jgi:hypothetical protein
MRVLLLQEQHVAGIPDTCILDIVAITPSDELTSSYSESEGPLGEALNRRKPTIPRCSTNSRIQPDTNRV